MVPSLGFWQVKVQVEAEKRKNVKDKPVINLNLFSL